MKKQIWFLLLIFSGCSSKFDPALEEKAIRLVLQQQEMDWNAGNIEGFMESYWKSDSLMFIGSAVTKGWDATLERYRKSYPDKEAMGTLDFTFYDFKFIDSKSCLVTGKYHLKRTADEPTGMFTLVLKKVGGDWVIIYDHTS
jgi:hypothetical protein